MPRRRSPSAPIATAAHAAATAPRRLRRALVPVSWWLGWVGFAALAALGVLALVPEDARPLGLTDRILPAAFVLATATAALVGWGCVQQGEERLRRAVGRFPAFVVFAVVPVALTLIGLVHEHGWADVGALPGGAWLLLALRIVPAVLVALGLLAFLTWRARPRGRMRWGRGAWWLFLVAPYAALVALTMLHVPAPDALREPLTDSLGSLARGSIAAQLAIGYFLGSRAPGRTPAA